MKKFWPVCLVALAFLPAKAQASYCYRTSYYAPSYGGYASYVQPYYQYVPKYVAYPVASYVGIPIPIFGSVYVGANGATNITTTATRTTTATSTQTAATATGATDAGAEILTAIKTLTALVGQVAQKQESQSSVLAALQRDHAELKQRFLAVEAKVNGMPPPVPAPAPPPPKKEDAPEAAGPAPKGEVALPAFYQTKCFSCHREGAVGLVKDKKKNPIVLFTKAGKRAALLQDPETGVDQAQSFLNHITDGTMPPPTKGPDGNRKFPELTPAEQTEGVLDVKNFPRRKS